MHWLDPDFLPVTEGTLDRFLLNPHAEVDGFLLTDGTEIHTPPHLSAQLLMALDLGKHVAVRGVKARHGGTIVAVAIDPEGGQRITDRGPKHDKPPRPHARHDKPIRHQGMIERVLHGPKGKAHGVLLSDGTIVRFAPHSAEALTDVLQVGAPLSVQGVACATPQGHVIEVSALGRHPSSLTEIPKDPKPHPKKPKGAGPKDHHPHA